MIATVPSLGILHAASSRFEAARQIDTLPAGDARRNVHGHGFEVTAYAALPQAWAAYPGGEVAALQQEVSKYAALLSYGLLNQHIAHPSDESLARWFRERLQVPGIERIAVKSTPTQGVEVDSEGRTYVWRRYRFRAAHRLPHVPLGHKCGRLHGHGFEVILHVGRDVKTAYPGIDYQDLDTVWTPVSALLDYHCLNEVRGLENPTSEMISSWLWERLKPVLPTLSWVTVYETASCGALFDGSKYRIWKDLTIDSAVRYQRAPVDDPRHAVHGHTYTLRLHLSAALDQLMGWTVDFGDVKAVFDPIFKSLDHHPLYQYSELEYGDTATIARWLYETTCMKLPELTRVDVFESDGCGSLVGADLCGPALSV
jgi:6-pyruvoyltetrahydropterin/6-carboxytetrahydropterin synthase